MVRFGETLLEIAMDSSFCALKRRIIAQHVDVIHVFPTIQQIFLVTFFHPQNKVFLIDFVTSG